MAERRPPAINHDLQHYVDMMVAGQPFSLARYGDGEWLTVLGHIGLKNSNGCTFTRALSEDLCWVLKNQHDYEHGILRISRRKLGGRIQRWLQENDVEIEWVIGDTMLEASLEGKLFPLVEQLRRRRVLYVGNERLRGLEAKGFFPYLAYVQPPARNAHQVRDELLQQVEAAIRRHRIDLIGWSCGLASKVFIDEIFARHPRVTQIDFGSMFDGYFEPLPHIQAMGRTGSRSYIRKGKYDWERLLAQNTGRSS